MPLVLVRHLPVALPRGVCYGRMDAALADEVLDQLPAFSRQLQEQHGPFDDVFSSPRERCRTMASAIATHHTVEPALAEMDFGQWEGRPWVEVPPGDLDLWSADLLNYRPGGGESVREMADRVIPWLDRSGDYARRTGKTVLAVTHGGPIRVALAMARRIPIDKAMDIPMGFGWAVRFG